MNFKLFFDIWLLLPALTKQDQSVTHAAQKNG